MSTRHPEIDKLLSMLHVYPDWCGRAVIDTSKLVQALDGVLRERDELRKRIEELESQNWLTFDGGLQLDSKALEAKVDEWLRIAKHSK